MLLKFLFAFALYAIAFGAFYMAVSIAPDMKWPNNPTEMNAAALLVIGMISKLAGHVTLITIR